MELKNTTLDDLASVIGFSATLRLAAWFGDRGNLYIPSTCAEGQLLVKLIGMSSAKRLTEEWGDQHVNVPRLRQYEDDLTKREIGRLLSHTMSTREIASTKRMSERRVQQICRELEAAGLIDIVMPRPVAKVIPTKEQQEKADSLEASRMVHLAITEKKRPAKAPGKSPRKRPKK